MRGYKSKYLEKGLLPLLSFLLLFNLLLIGNVSAYNPNSVIIFYNFSQPNGMTLSNTSYPALIFNAGVGNSGSNYNLTTPINPVMSGDVNLNYSVLLNNIVPFGNGTNTAFVNVYNYSELERTNSKKEGTYINTNSYPLNINDSFSYSIWVKPESSLSNQEEINLLTIQPSNFSTGSHQLLQFYIENNSGQALIKLSFGYTSDITNCSLSQTNLFRLNSSWNEFGFTWNGSNLLSGNATKLYVNGKPVQNCTNTVTSFYPVDIFDRYIIGYSNQFNTNFFSSEMPLVTNVGLWNFVLNDSQMYDQYNLSFSNINTQQTSVFSCSFNGTCATNGTIIGNIISLFPDSNTLTAVEKATYVILVMLLIPLVLIIALVLGRVGETTIKAGVYLSLVLDFFTFFYFVSIGYVSIGLLIAMILIAVAIVLMRFKGAG